MLSSLSPRAFLGSPGDNGVKLFADPRFQEERGRRFADLSFDLVGGVLFLGEMLGQHIQLGKAVRARLRPAMAAFTSRCVIRSGYRRFGAVEWA